MMASLQKDERFSCYLPLHRYIYHHDKVGVDRFCKDHPKAKNGPITEREETALMLAIKWRKSIDFIKELLVVLEFEKDIEFQNKRGNTALHEVAVDADYWKTTDGGYDIVDLLLGKSRNLMRIKNSDGYLPVDIAAEYGHRKLVFHFLEKHNGVLDWDEKPPVTLLHIALNNTKLFDFATQLLRCCPGLGSNRNKSASTGDEKVSPLEIIAERPHAFQSGTQLNIWDSFLYNYCFGRFPFTFQGDSHQTGIWEVLDKIVPRWKHVREKKLEHYGSQYIVPILFMHLDSSTEDVTDIINKSFLQAVKHGIEELVKEILNTFPSAIDAKDEDGCSALHLAVMYRHENVFNFLIQQGGVQKHFWITDNKGNNILHMAGQMPRQQKLLPSLSVLQVQRELKWYKEIEKLVPVQASTSKNGKRDDTAKNGKGVAESNNGKGDAQGKTPIEVFEEEHSKMIESEEKWIVSMAGACTVATTIIGTIAFAAATTVPGGNTTDGRPLFSAYKTFNVFACSNSVAFYSSISTFLIFLSIYTARYAAPDYEFALPNKLIFGLLSLFISITSTVVAFGSAMYLLCPTWIAIVSMVLSCIPVALFTFFQFPLFVNMCKTTYGNSMLRQQSRKARRFSSNLDKAKSPMARRFSKIWKLFGPKDEAQSREARRISCISKWFSPKDEAVQSRKGRRISSIWKWFIPKDEAVQSRNASSEMV